MITFRNLAALAMFLFGTTFVWLTPMFVAEDPKPDGLAWGAVSILSWAVMIGFTAGAWAIFKDLSWWEPVAIASAVLGIVTLTVYGLAVMWAGGIVGAGVNLVIHIAGIVGVFLATTFAPVHEWMTAHI